MKETKRKDSKRNPHGLKRRSSYPLKDCNFRIAVLGEAGVGKSALTVQFICRRFLSEYDPTLEDTYTKDVVIDGKERKIHFLDTAGHDEEESFSLSREGQLRANDAFIIVYSETDRQSFDSAKDIHANIVRCCKDRGIQNIPIALVGNKTDLAQCRRVGSTEGEKLAEDLGHRCRHFRTSAAQGHTEIDSAVDFLVREKMHADAFPKSKGRSVSVVKESAAAGQMPLTRSVSLQEFGLKSVHKRLLKLIPKLK